MSDFLWFLASNLKIVISCYVQFVCVFRVSFEQSSGSILGASGGQSISGRVALHEPPTEHPPLSAQEFHDEFLATPRLFDTIQDAVFQKKQGSQIQWKRHKITCFRSSSCTDLCIYLLVIGEMCGMTAQNGSKAILIPNLKRKKEIALKISNY